MNLRKEDLEKQFKGGIEKRNQLLNKIRGNDLSGPNLNFLLSVY